MKSAEYSRTGVDLIYDVEKQLRTGDTIVRDLSERLAEED